MSVLLFILFFLLFLLGFVIGMWYKPGKGDNYGQIVILTSEDGHKLFSLELDKDPAEIEKLDRVYFKVTNTPSVGYETDD